MSAGVLFWGFQNFQVVSEAIAQLRKTTEFKKFFVQIDDVAKTTYFFDVSPEEIIRVEGDFENLYQWLSRFTHEDLYIFVDVFSTLFHWIKNDNYISIRTILELNFKIFFIAPKILNPQNVHFFQDQEVQAVDQLTAEYTKKLKLFYETILNSSSLFSIIPCPVPESVVLNGVLYDIFRQKRVFGVEILPKELKKFPISFMSNQYFVSILVEKIHHLVEKKFFFLTSEKPDKQLAPKKNSIRWKKSSFFIRISMEKFFSVKENSAEHKYILWLLYLSICEHETGSDTSEQKINNFFFPKITSL